MEGMAWDTRRRRLADLMVLGVSSSFTRSVHSLLIREDASSAAKNAEIGRWHGYKMEDARAFPGLRFEVALSGKETSKSARGLDAVQNLAEWSKPTPVLPS
ncbi:MAG: hypothetical protein JWM16_1445 [Verrucomicrobiales bacterium]|nr:hypothetical protein [Verrucomicrobiales bacterium]